MLIVFIGAYKLITHMLNSRIERRLFKQHNPKKPWHSIYKPIGVISACIFAIITNYLIVDAQYLMAFVSVLFIGGSIWVYRRC
ncbi:MAG: hypothetical protein COB24_05030 [Hyphomicrobiales bacterium]|nr:MAG: hypothetical protein COB24_05030 [Hyphomicrobiales bacterium]